MHIIKHNYVIVCCHLKKLPLISGVSYNLVLLATLVLAKG